jgi:hypothetical protein
MQLAAQVKSAPYIEAKIDVVCASLQVLWGTAVATATRVLLGRALHRIGSRWPRSPAARRGTPACIIGGNLVGARLAAVVFVRHGTSWSLPEPRHCFAAHPRFGVQFFSLGDKVEWLVQRSWSWELANAVAWLAVAIGWSLGLVALVNEVRALPSAS